MISIATPARALDDLLHDSVLRGSFGLDSAHAFFVSDPEDAPLVARRSAGASGRTSAA